MKRQRKTVTLGDNIPQYTQVTPKLMEMADAINMDWEQMFWVIVKFGMVMAEQQTDTHEAAQSLSQSTQLAPSPFWNWFLCEWHKRECDLAVSTEAVFSHTERLAGFDIVRGMERVCLNVDEFHLFWLEYHVDKLKNTVIPHHIKRAHTSKKIKRAAQILGA